MALYKGKYHLFQNTADTLRIFDRDIPLPEGIEDITDKVIDEIIESVGIKVISTDYISISIYPDCTAYSDIIVVEYEGLSLAIELRNISHTNLADEETIEYCLVSIQDDVVKFVNDRNKRQDSGMHVVVKGLPEIMFLVQHDSPFNLAIRDRYLELMNQLQQDSVERLKVEINALLKA